MGTGYDLDQKIGDVQKEEENLEVVEKVNFSYDISEFLKLTTLRSKAIIKLNGLIWSNEVGIRSPKVLELNQKIDKFDQKIQKFESIFKRKNDFQQHE